MASHPGAEPTSRVSRCRGPGGSVSPPETLPGAADEQDAPATAPETADIYRTLFTELRRAFGGTLDDANADAIAYAASELYHKDVEPRLWEQKTAHEILDTFGVPRAGAFTRYSLSDRLFLLRRSADPGRADQAHALLTDLGAPESDPTGSRLSLKDRLAWLLEGPGPVSAVAAASDPDPSPGPDEDDPPDPDEPTAEAAEPGPTEAAPAPSTDLPAAELVGLGTLIAGIQDELIRLRQAVEVVERRVDEVLVLLRDAAAGPAAAPATATEPDGSLESVPPPPAAAPDDLTRVVPVAPGGTPLDEVPAGPARRRRRGLKLVIITVVLGLLIAGVAIAISVVGWTELRDRLRMGSLGLAACTLAAAAANPDGGTWWTRSRR